MKRIFTIILLGITTTVFAQYPDTTYENRTVRKQAKKITKSYHKQLGLDGKQYPIFLDMVEDYLVLANNAKETLEGKAELDALTQLMAEETLKMQDVLTRPQYNLYRKIRQDIQPIKTVVSK